MGAKTNTQTLSTKTPLQQALMSAMIKNAMAQMQGQTLGGAWGGAKASSFTPTAPNVGSPPPVGGGSELPPGLLARILSQTANGARDQFTGPFSDPFRNGLQ